MAASNPSNPSPSKENITSISRDPVNKILMNALGNPAITINIAFRKTCRCKIFFWLNPFDFAVITYCLLISSRNEFLVNMVRLAKPAMAMDKTGSVICHK